MENLNNEIRSVDIKSVRAFTLKKRPGMIAFDIDGHHYASSDLDGIEFYVIHDADNGFISIYVDGVSYLAEECKDKEFKEEATRYLNAYREYVFENQEKYGTFGDWPEFVWQ